MQQAARISDYAAFMFLGEIIEFAPIAELFTHPRKPQTEAYVTGRFG
jgi:phosphate transport system ATP-binding protein